jgi:hypothetical protein
MSKSEISSQETTLKWFHLYLFTGGCQEQVHLYPNRFSESVSNKSLNIVTPASDGVTEFETSERASARRLFFRGQL